jgi:putative restriction endonuclease
LSGLPEPLLLDATHIVSDKDARLGQSAVTDIYGLPLPRMWQKSHRAHQIVGGDALID